MGEKAHGGYVRFLVLPNVDLERHRGEGIHARELASYTSRADTPHPLACR